MLDLQEQFNEVKEKLNNRNKQLVAIQQMIQVQSINLEEKQHINEIREQKQKLFSHLMELQKSNKQLNKKFYQDTQNSFEEIDQNVLQSMSHYRQRNEMQQLEQKLMDLRLANKQQKVISMNSKNEDCKISSESSTQAPIEQSKEECQEGKHQDVMNSLEDDNGGPNSIAKKIIQQSNNNNNNTPHKKVESQSNNAVVASSQNGGVVKEVDTDDKAMGLSDFKYDLVFDDDQNQEEEEEEDDDDDGQQQEGYNSDQ